MNHCEHGGDLLQQARLAGHPPEKWLDFSASINPLGMPPEVVEAAHEGLTRSIHYPEVRADGLQQRLADYHGLPKDCLLPGPGATDLLYRLFREVRVRQALVVCPAFGEYARSIERAEGKIHPFHLSAENGFALDGKRLLGAVETDTDWIVLANPGNPSGAGIAPAELEVILERLPAGVSMLVDEAFVDFCPQRSLLVQRVRHPQLWVLRSLTKFYAIPGLRAGYLVGPSGKMTMVEAGLEPWALSTPAQMAAEACVGLDSFRRETLEVIPRWRDELRFGLEKIGIHTFPSEANFLLAKLSREGSASVLRERLLKYGILIRPCRSFSPLDDTYFRVAVRSPEENQRLLQALSAEL